MKKEWLKNKRTKIDNILFNTFGPLVSFECLWSTKKKLCVENHRTKLGFNWLSGFIRFKTYNTLFDILVLLFLSCKSDQEKQKTKRF